MAACCQQGEDRSRWSEEVGGEGGRKGRQRDGRRRQEKKDGQKTWRGRRQEETDEGKTEGGRRQEGENEGTSRCSRKTLTDPGGPVFILRLKTCEGSAGESLLYWVLEELQYCRHEPNWKQQTGLFRTSSGLLLWSSD